MTLTGGHSTVFFCDPPNSNRTQGAADERGRGRRRGPTMGLKQRNLVRHRLQQVSRNLDLGYLPGNNSRNGSSEIIRPEIFDQLPDWKLLPEPPSPPNTP